MGILKGLAIAAVAVAVGGGAFVEFAPQVATPLATDLERKVAGLERKETDIPGFHIAYLEGGRGEPLVLVHGFSADKDNWARVSRGLTAHYHVVALDLPGFGESSKPADQSYDVDRQIERLHDFVGKLGLKGVHLGGSSMGGLIVARYAARYPEEVKSLWLVAPAGVSTAKRSEMFERLAGKGPNPLIAHNSDEFVGVFDFVMNDPPFIPTPMIRQMGAVAVANYPLNERIFAELVKTRSLEDTVRGLPVPTRILWGEQDRVLNVDGARILNGLLPKSSVTVMSGVGHLPMLERPKESAADYLSFRNTLVGG